MSKRPASIASFDSETLDFFDDRNASFRTSKLTAAGAVFGSAPRYRAPTDPAQRTIATQPSPSSRLQRRSSEALPRAIPTTPSRLRSSSAAQVQEKVPERPGSPDIEAILAKTPRPRKTSTVSPPRSLLRSGQRSQSTLSLRLNAKERKSVAEDDESIFSISDYGMLLEEDESQSDEAGGSESDSSIDIHTPLPHLMFRDGLLSPRSKLLPQDSKKPAVYPFKEKADDRSRSVLSIASTVGSFVTKTGLQKDPRHTERRRQRHRDGSLLRAGMGLTTGLGWSDSEDEDAPSALTRRLITTTIDRKRSASVALSSPSRPTSGYDELGMSRFASPVPMSSRFTSPVPPSRQLPRKSSGTHLGMRSMSVSQLQNRAATVSFPSMPLSTEPKLPTMPEEAPKARNRTTSVSSNTKSIPKTPPTPSSGLPHASPSRQRNTSSASSKQIPSPRSRAGSVASTVTSAGAGSRSRATSSASTTPSHIGRVRTESSASSTGHSIPSVPRPSLDSLASVSTSSLTSTGSNSSGSVYSTSTASASSGSGPRPLRLVQSLSSRSQSQDHIAASASTSSISASAAPVPPQEVVASASVPHQRTRTLSGPRPRPQARSPTPTQSPTQSFSSTPLSPQQRPFRFPLPSPADDAGTTSPSFASPPGSSSTVYFSPVTSPSVGSSHSESRPTSPSSPRQRPILIGARPKPRTGTGMAYRTSSFPNLQAQASALRMRTLATGPTPVTMSAEGSAYPVRI